MFQPDSFGSRNRYKKNNYWNFRRFLARTPMYTRSLSARSSRIASEPTGGYDAEHIQRFTSLPSDRQHLVEIQGPHRWTGSSW
jgi:hypothetical protein